MRTGWIAATVLMLGLLGCKGDKAPSPSAESAKPQPAGEPAKQVEPPPEPPAAPPAAAPSKPDLDKLCAKAKELAASPKEQQAALWSKAVREIEDPQIKKGFSAIAGADADMQYELAIQIAKEAGAPGWTCPDLKTLMHSMK